MIIPIGDDQVKGGYFPYFSYSFIGLNVLVFLLQASMPQNQLEQFVLNYGAIPSEITSGLRWWTLFTSMFLHGGWMHLIGNMLFLWVFADNIEATIGHFRFLFFYFMGGLAAHFGHIFFNYFSDIPTVGASGAISAVMGAYLFMFPGSKIRLVFLPFLFIHFIFPPFRIPAFLFLGFWIYQQFMSGTASLQGATIEDMGVAWWAHIGGFIFGVLAGLYYRTLGKQANNRDWVQNDYN